MEFSCSRRVRAKLSHPDPKKAVSPNFFHPFTSIIGHFTAFRPQNPTVVIAMCRFPMVVIFFVLFPMAMFLLCHHSQYASLFYYIIITSPPLALVT